MIDMPTLEMVQTEHFRKSETRQMKERKKQREVLTANVQSCAKHFCQLLNTCITLTSRISQGQDVVACFVLFFVRCCLFSCSFNILPYLFLVWFRRLFRLALHKLQVQDLSLTSLASNGWWQKLFQRLDQWKPLGRHLGRHLVTSCHILSHLVVQTQVMHGDAVMAPKRCMLWRVQTGQQNEAWFACWRPSRQSGIIWCQRMAKASLRPGHG